MIRESHRRGPVTTVRYERERYGELVHIDVKRVARIPDGGWAFLHIAVDDCSRVTCVELLGDERGATCVAFMGRCLAHFAGMGVRVERVMTDDGPGHCGRAFNSLLAGLGVRHRHTRP